MNSLYASLAVTLLTAPVVVLAQDAPNRVDEAPLTQEQMDAAEKDDLELEPLEVTGEGWSYDQEVTLRLIRQAYNRPKSFRQEDRDVWICWTQRATGSKFRYLGCARNGDLWALQPDNGINQMPTGIAGYGRIQVSTHPVNTWKLERALESLPGDTALDEEFTLKVLNGETPSRDIPDEAELDTFIEAYRSVGKLARRGATEAQQVRAIEDAGLSLKRYNRIVDLLEEFGTLKNTVGERLKSSASAVQHAAQPSN